MLIMYAENYLCDEPVITFTKGFTGEIKNKSKEIRQSLETDSGRMIIKSKGWRYIFNAELVVKTDFQAMHAKELSEKEMIIFQPYDDKDELRFTAYVEYDPSGSSRKYFGEDDGYSVMSFRFTSVVLKPNPPDITAYSPAPKVVWPANIPDAVLSSDDFVLIETTGGQEQ